MLLKPQIFEEIFGHVLSQIDLFKTPKSTAGQEIPKTL